jgi:hypothetical protein
LRSTLSTFAGLLWKKVLVNVGEDTTLCNSDVAEKLVQFFVIADGELKVTGDDTGLLVVTGSVASQFEDFCGKVFEDSGKVDRGTSTDPLCIVAFPQETVDRTDGESKAGLGRTALRLLSGTGSGLATRFSSSHFDSWFFLKKLS